MFVCIVSVASHSGTETSAVSTTENRWVIQITYLFVKWYCIEFVIIISLLQINTLLSSITETNMKLVVGNILSISYWFMSGVKHMMTFCVMYLQLNWRTSHYEYYYQMESFPRYWPSWWESTPDLWFPSQRIRNNQANSSVPSELKFIDDHNDVSMLLTCVFHIFADSTRLRARVVCDLKQTVNLRIIDSKNICRAVEPPLPRTLKNVRLTSQLNQVRNVENQKHLDVQFAWKCLLRGLCCFPIRWGIILIIVYWWATENTKPNRG